MDDFLINEKHKLPPLNAYVARTLLTSGGRHRTRTLPTEKCARQWATRPCPPRARQPYYVCHRDRMGGRNGDHARR